MDTTLLGYTVFLHALKPLLDRSRALVSGFAFVLKFFFLFFCGIALSVNRMCSISFVCFAWLCCATVEPFSPFTVACVPGEVWWTHFRCDAVGSACLSFSSVSCYLFTDPVPKSEEEVHAMSGLQVR